jgi:hypothetical protein
MEKVQQNQYYQQPLTAPSAGSQWGNHDRHSHGRGHDHGHDEIDRYSQDEQVPEDPKERWKRHFRYTLSIREEKHVFKGFFQNLRVFLLDCWLDIITVLITIAVAAAVRPHYTPQKATLTDAQRATGGQS